MNTAVRRKQTAFRLSETLLEDLKFRASMCNRSLNNYVESLLIEAMREAPNSDTAEAVAETRSGKYAGTLDMTSFEGFLSSIDSAT